MRTGEGAYVVACQYKILQSPTRASSTNQPVRLACSSLARPRSGWMSPAHRDPRQTSPAATPRSRTWKPTAASHWPRAACLSPGCTPPRPVQNDGAIGSRRRSLHIDRHMPVEPQVRWLDDCRVDPNRAAAFRAGFVREHLLPVDHVEPARIALIVPDFQCHDSKPHIPMFCEPQVDYHSLPAQNKPKPLRGITH